MTELNEMTKALRAKLKAFASNYKEWKYYTQLCDLIESSVIVYSYTLLDNTKATVLMNFDKYDSKGFYFVSVSIPLVGLPFYVNFTGHYGVEWEGKEMIKIPLDQYISDQFGHWIGEFVKPVYDRFVSWEPNPVE